MSSEKRKAESTPNEPSKRPRVDKEDKEEKEEKQAKSSDELHDGEEIEWEGEAKTGSDSDDAAFRALPPKQQFSTWLQEEKEEGTNPSALFEELGLENILELFQTQRTAEIGPAEFDNLLWKLLDSMADEENPFLALQDLNAEADETLHFRRKLPHVETFEEALEEIRKAQHIIVLAGAGISSSSGIPDFRSPGGIYEQIKAKHPDLQDPQDLFNIHRFHQDPKPFFEFAQLYPSDAVKPTASHMFIRLLQDKGKLLHLYTQNIDTLEDAAGIHKLTHCHGSFRTATCTNEACADQLKGEDIKDTLLKGQVPQCPRCSKGILKPDIVFFGEPLTDDFKDRIEDDIKACDLLLVMGSSMRVQPVSLVPRLLAKYRPKVPQLLINKELVMEPHEWDFFFQGDCDSSVAKIAQGLGLPLPSASDLREKK